MRSLPNVAIVEVQFVKSKSHVIARAGGRVALSVLCEGRIETPARSNLHYCKEIVSSQRTLLAMT